MLQAIAISFFHDAMYGLTLTSYHHSMNRTSEIHVHERNDAAPRVPPHVYFLTSAVFHYLGPAFAVLLFAQVAVLGVAWLRIASAALVFALWRRPWLSFALWTRPQRQTLVALGLVLGLMNACFYLAIARVPLGTVSAIEFLGPIALAAYGARGRRNLIALGLAVFGVTILTDLRWEGAPLGFAFAFANCALFALYIVLGHRVAHSDETRVDRLGAAMLIALVTVTPLGFAAAIPAFLRPDLLLAGIGVGICSSVIPYVCDQLAMARLPRATFALMLAMLPAIATIIGAAVLRQYPGPTEIAGILLIVIAVAAHEAGG
jgi:inner membrane transporter RhtA